MLPNFISDDNWDVNDAKVACRMLGFNTSSTVVRISSTFGSGELDESLV